MQEAQQGRHKVTLLGDTTGTHRVTNAKTPQCLLLQTLAGETQATRMACGASSGEQPS